MGMKQQVSLLVSYWPLENGKYPIDTGPDVIQLPENIGTFACSIDKLVSKVYPDLLSNFRNIMAWFQSGAFWHHSMKSPILLMQH